MSLYNLKTTYIILTENIDVFSSLIVSGKNIIVGDDLVCDKTKVKNLFFVDNYVFVIDKYIEEIFLLRYKQGKVRDIKECLSYEHLLEKNIFHSGEKINGKATFSITKHFMELIKDIYKEKSTPMSRDEYNDFIFLSKKYIDFFSSDTVIYRGKEFSNKAIRFESILEEVYGKMLGSISSLEYERSNTLLMDSSKVDTIEVMKEKLSQVKILQERYILPLYRFTNKRSSEFMIGLDLLRLKLSSNNKGQSQLLGTINHYYLQYLFIATKIKPIKDYITSYVKQSEEGLFRNAGNEGAFNELLLLVEEMSLGQGRVQKFDNVNLNEKDLFYENKSEVYKEYGIKKHEVDSYFIKRVILEMNERSNFLEVENIQQEMEQGVYEKILARKEEEEVEKMLEMRVLSVFKEDFMKKSFKSGDNIVSMLVHFLETREISKKHWNVGHLQNLTKQFLYKYENNVRLINTHSNYIKDNKDFKYQNLIWE